jgi:hypothetical protein
VPNAGERLQSVSHATARCVRPGFETSRPRAEMTARLVEIGQVVRRGAGNHGRLRKMTVHGGHPGVCTVDDLLRCKLRVRQKLRALT